MTFRFAYPGVVRLVFVFTALCLARTASADEPVTISVTLRDHRFSPSEIHVTTGKPTILKIRNEDDTAEEFDSTALKVEKIIAAGGSATIRLRPLGPGRFPFMGEFHPDTARGAVISE
ncbi:MAG TPA: cupredoxin domain-containing protein [Rhodopila sp.]|nr:cupredoxin domain-containing protein [Rhodopila sp.]